MAQGMADFRLHQPEFGRAGLRRRFAEIGIERGQQGGFVPRQRAAQGFQVRAPERQRAGRAGLEERALTLDGGGKIHIQLGQSSCATYKFVKQ
jgi:hypothetical protein